MGKITEEQIAEWKDAHKELIVLETEDGKKAILRDPIYDLNVMKAAITALRKNDYDFVDCILTNCWLGGDEEIRKDEAYQIFLVDNLKELVELPDFTVTKDDIGYLITSEGVSIGCRAATRADITKAEKRNHNNQPFATAEFILNEIADKNYVQDIKKLHPKAFLGILRGVEEVKDKKILFIKKL